ncbi:hypothetical protein Nepgr_004428 [Nepenthes gracilis]|uniref:Uncharacterized protein n=1 Tax=Nepenthes gracilis TaxID=150966 RepID=A0AAD3S1Q5_NEPGR|nr:hypothetical protein Nepgr_004428 [Nepenthes gracilis]
MRIQTPCNEGSNIDDAGKAEFSFSKDEKQRGEEEREDEGDQPESPTRRVKEDLSKLRESLARQVWGVANFLAPPPPSINTRSETHDQRYPLSRSFSECNAL